MSARCRGCLPSMAQAIASHSPSISTSPAGMCKSMQVGVRVRLGAGFAGSGSCRTLSGTGDAGHGVAGADRAHSDGAAGRAHDDETMACDDPQAAVGGAGAQSSLRSSLSEPQLLVRCSRASACCAQCMMAKQGPMHWSGAISWCLINDTPWPTACVEATCFHECLGARIKQVCRRSYSVQGSGLGFGASLKP